MIKSFPTNECEVIVEALTRWFGERTPNEEFQACEEIKTQIAQHVDGVGNIRIHQKQTFITNDKLKFDTLYEALEHLFDGDGCKPDYYIRYERPADGGVGSRERVCTFEKMIELAWKNPHNFTLLPESKPLSKAQKEFLNRVIEGAMTIHV